MRSHIVSRGNHWIKMLMVHGSSASVSRPWFKLDFSGDNWWCPCFVLIAIIINLCSPGIFTVEMCAKIFAMGFICHENSYLRYCHLSMLVCSIRIVPQGKLQLVLILAIMSLGRVILYYLILNVHKPYQFQTTPNTFTITRMDIGGSICHLVNLSIFMFLKQLQYFSKIPVGMFIQWDQ